MDFYKTRLTKMGIDVITPEKPDHDFIHISIMEELLKEQFLSETRNGFISIMDDLKSKGAEGVILGCIEIPLLIKQTDYDLPVFSRLKILAEAITNYSLNN